MPKEITDWDSAYKYKPYVEREPHPEISAFLSMLQGSGLDNVLDLGCGDGRHLIFLSKMGMRTIGLDKSLWGLRRSKSWLVQDDLSYYLACGDMITLPFSDSCFDAVISIQVIHHNLAQAVKGTIKEVSRVLRKGGYFLLSVPNYKPDERWERDYIEVEPYTYVPQEGFEVGIVHHLFTKERMVEYLSGFSVLWVKDDLKTNKHLIALARKSI